MVQDYSSIWEKVNRKRELSYRYYKHLSESDKELLSIYLPNFKCFIMQLHKAAGFSIKLAIKIALKHYDEYLEWCSKRTVFTLPEKNLKYVKDELKFRGFIRLPLYKGFKPKIYGYIITNKEVDGDIWVYPKRFGSDYKKMQSGYEDIHKSFCLIALEGHTKILYKDGYRG